MDKEEEFDYWWNEQIKLEPVLPPIAYELKHREKRAFDTGYNRGYIQGTKIGLQKYGDARDKWMKIAKDLDKELTKTQKELSKLIGSDDSRVAAYRHERDLVFDAWHKESDYLWKRLNYAKILLEQFVNYDESTDSVEKLFEIKDKSFEFLKEFQGQNFKHVCEDELNGGQK